MNILKHMTKKIVQKGFADSRLKYMAKETLMMTNRPFWLYSARKFCYLKIEK